MSNSYSSKNGRGIRDCTKSSSCAPKENVYLGWDKLVKQLEDKGYSKDYAEKVAGKINKEKYGK